jgi:phospholipid/cholesterol/gamma-HCH transport system substrate-binding protein
MRQHVFGTYPLDPNLIAQGIPPDDRVNWNRERIFGPVEGTPLPPGAVPRGTPPSAGPPPLPAPLNPAAQMSEVSPIAPIDVPSPPAGPPTGAASGAPAGPSVAPSAFGRDGSQPGPSVAVAQYNPHTGIYVAPDGQVYRQSDLVKPATPKAPKTWKDMFAT